MRETCAWCGGTLDPPRPNKKFCGSSCRAANTHARRGTPGRPRKALRTAARPRRRATKDGLGARVYVTPGELTDLLQGKVPSTVSAKLAKAGERLGAS